MTEKKEGEKGFLDKLTGSLGKVSALVAVVAAIVTGIVKIMDSLPDKKTPDKADSGNCVSLEMVTSPSNVSVSEWKDKLELRLQGKNDCKERVNAYVNFKAMGVELQLKTPLFCDDRNNPDCWETKSLDTGEVDWRLTKPALTVLSELREPVDIDINWTVKAADQKPIFLSKKATVTVRHD